MGNHSQPVFTEELHHMEEWQHRADVCSSILEEFLGIKIKAIIFEDSKGSVMAVDEDCKVDTDSRKSERFQVLAELLWDGEITLQTAAKKSGDEKSFLEFIFDVGIYRAGHPDCKR